MDKRASAKAKQTGETGLFRVSLELCKTALGAVIRAVVSHWLDRH